MADVPCERLRFRRSGGGLRRSGRPDHLREPLLGLVRDPAPAGFLEPAGEVGVVGVVVEHGSGILSPFARFVYGICSSPEAAAPPALPELASSGWPACQSCQVRFFAEAGGAHAPAIGYAFSRV